MMAMPTASMRRETSPQSFQNLMPLRAIIPLCPGRLDLRGSEEAAVVVVILVLRRGKAELAGPLQELGARLEHLAPLGIVAHADQRRAHRGHLVGRHLR